MVIVAFNIFTKSMKKAWSATGLSGTLSEKSDCQSYAAKKEKGSARRRRGQTFDKELCVFCETK